ncbi:MAG TPA: nucleoside hydrolase [Gemmatimonadales bacterium]|nr:nucleoside hydrolase [Gemmatimonadales bacterium]
MSRPSARPPVRPPAIVIDTDPGIDDAVTLALAARSPELEVVAVIATYGNAALAETTRNARAALARAGRPDIRVHAGGARPLSRPPVTGAAMHGPSGIGHAAVTPAPAVTPDPSALFRVLSAATAPVTLLTLGPLTDLAHALEEDAAMVARAVGRHIAMLGAFAERGAPDRLADFNAWADPDAAHRVLHAGLRTQLVPLDVARRMTTHARDVARLAASPDGLTQWLAAALRFSVEAHRAVRGVDGCALNDVLTLGEVLAPGLLGFEERQITVDLDEGERRGHTREAADGVLMPVATSADVARMRSLLGRVFKA